MGEEVKQASIRDTVNEMVGEIRALCCKDCTWQYSYGCKVCIKGVPKIVDRIKSIESDKGVKVPEWLITKGS